MPEMLQFMADWLNEGERYEKLPRFIPYMALPIGMALLTFRFAQIAYQILTGKLDRMISGHEAEEELEALKEELKDAGDAMEPKQNKHNSQDNDKSKES
ncbi:MAG: TRAP transporter small permease, partial [Vibrionaceae bacterium]|nr:TRAP transporter small permease [Vibrionaceae bacterium]